LASVVANGVRLEYEWLGADDAPVVLLVMGLGMQLVSWPDPFCTALARHGLRVLRFDNRDCGLSQKLDHLGRPPLLRALLRARLGLPVRAPYGLEDMAADSTGLLDVLGVPAAHVVGASMGGMIGQLMAARYPARVRTLTSIMSSSGARYLPHASRRVQRQLLQRPADPGDIDCVVGHLLALFTAIGSPGFPTPPDELRARLRRSVERGYHPAGVLRQMLAIMADGDRSARLRRIACPTLVIHGRADPLVPFACGVDTAIKIANSRLVAIDGFGHDFPPQLFERLAALIARHALGAAA
jgi:pimeloyl-ACP methyl ester carboxylesterase